MSHRILIRTYYVKEYALGKEFRLAQEFPNQLEGILTQEEFQKIIML